MFGRLLGRCGPVSSRVGAAGLRRVACVSTATATAPRSAVSSAVSSRVFAPSATGAKRVFTNSSFLNGTNSAYIEQTYLQWKADPSSVHVSWDVFFKTGKYTPPPSLVADYSPSASSSGPRVVSGSSGSSAGGNENSSIAALVRAHQVRGHLVANLDPLGLTPPVLDPKELDIEAYGFTSADLDREFDVAVPQIRGFLGADRGRITLRNLVTRLKETYRSTVGWEYMHIQDVEQCNFLRERIETREARKFSKEEKLTILDRLMWADHFERFLALKWAATKRFGLEGGESTIPGTKALLAKASELGVENVVIGMPHRGRLNVLSTVMRKPLEAIMHDFRHGHHDEKNPPRQVEGSGDVKYHLGYSIRRSFGKANREMHLSLLANPSHLEAVDPVVCGKTRAKQFLDGDESRSKSMALLLHGDAAFAGQGVVWETLSMTDLPDYATGGVVHIVVNNQVGFTTDPAVARSTPYCTDLAKAVNAPIFHVNGDDPEAVHYACEVAAEWRQKFKKDVVIDLICYRKHGHNEIDEPKFTQPQMYDKIQAMQKEGLSSLGVYQKRLIAEGTVTADEMKKLSANINAELEKGFVASEHYTPKPETSWLQKEWKGLHGTTKNSPIRDTGVSADKLKDIGLKFSSYPDNLSVHPRLAGIYKKKKESIAAGKDIDWATGEALAFGSLLEEGIHVRLSGQDVERGTFSHRHAVIVDQKADRKYYEPLNNLSANQAKFSVSNSHLSEFAVLGFELGYSMEHPKQLVLWEAQFGDFANGAQIIIDQFLAAGEDKWLRQTGLTLLLPHGYEGQGPEHSSARLERFLQGSKEHPDVMPPADAPMQVQNNNWQVIMPTTPANYFHALRRQIHRDFRKPLIVMAPKALLRAPEATSTIADMAAGTRFQPVIPDTGATAAADKVRRVIFCSGKVYYDLDKYRKEKKITDVAVARVEQISPFPFHRVQAEAKRFPNADVLWCQEEPMNMGSWTHVAPRIETALRGAHKTQRPRYAGRQPSASTAAGHQEDHEAELHAFLKDAFRA